MFKLYKNLYLEQFDTEFTNIITVFYTSQNPFSRDLTQKLVNMFLDLFACLVENPLDLSVDMADKESGALKKNRYTTIVIMKLRNKRKLTHQIES